MAISKKTWDKLDDSQKNIVKKAAEEGKKIQRAENNKSNEAAKKELLDNGVKINENPDVEAFKKIAVDQWHIYTDKYGSELLDQITEGK